MKQIRTVNLLLLIIASLIHSSSAQAMLAQLGRAARTAAIFRQAATVPTTNTLQVLNTDTDSSVLRTRFRQFHINSNGQLHNDQEAQSNRTNEPWWQRWKRWLFGALLPL